MVDGVKEHIFLVVVLSKVTRVPSQAAGSSVAEW